MYPYHEVLSIFSPDIEFYVVDLELTPCSRPLVKITILTSHIISRRMQVDIENSILLAMTHDDCKRLAIDLGWQGEITSIVQLRVEVRYFGESKK